MVAMDENGKAFEVPKWEPKTEQDKRQYKSALKLMEMRNQIHDEMTTYLDAQ